MKRTTLNYVVDAVFLLAMSGMIWTGVVIRYILPPGTGGHRRGRQAGHAMGGGHAMGDGHGADALTESGWTLWGWGRHEWGDVHFVLALMVTGFLILHVALHWKWVCDVTRGLAVGSSPNAGAKSRWKRDLLGWGFLVLTAGLMGLTIWWAQGRVHKPASSRSVGPAEHAPGDAGHQADAPHARRRAGQAGITGKTTLEELERGFGVPLEAVRRRFGLPDTVPSSERLGRLRRTYGFHLAQVRDFVNAYPRGRDDE